MFSKISNFLTDPHGIPSSVEMLFLVEKFTEMRRIYVEKSFDTEAGEGIFLFADTLLIVYSAYPFCN